MLNKWVFKKKIYFIPLPGGEVDDDDDDEGMGRDWLDWIYVLSRMVVLLSIVYFYSTVSRFMIVVCIAMLLYLWVFLCLGSFFYTDWNFFCVAKVTFIENNKF